MQKMQHSNNSKKLPPGLPEPTQFTLSTLLTRPILNTNTLNNGAYKEVIKITICTIVSVIEIN